MTDLYWSFPDWGCMEIEGLMGEDRSQGLLRGGLSGNSFVSLNGGSCCMPQGFIRAEAAGCRLLLSLQRHLLRRGSEVKP